MHLLVCYLNILQSARCNDKDGNTVIKMVKYNDIYIYIYILSRNGRYVSNVLLLEDVFNPAFKVTFCFYLTETTLRIFSENTTGWLQLKY